MSYSSNAPLKDRVAIVTGGSGGIGRETSKALLENGATVVMSGRNREQGEEVARELGLEFFPADVTHSEEIRQLAQHVQRRFAVNALKEPGSLFAATAAQNPFAMAQKATEIGYEIMNGRIPESKTILIPVTLVTREDVGKFQGWTR
jgi:NAD(P)-dependent dehydrogenase (short-subunit alcohol dehydrogenase family)